MAENDAKSDAKSPENADITSEAQAKKPSKAWPGAVLLAGLILGSASAAVVAASLVVRPAAPRQAETAPAVAKAEEQKAEAPCEFTLEEPLIVNVYQTQQRRYLSVKPVLVLKGKSTLEKVKAKQVELQHLMIGILKHKTLEQLDDPDAANGIGREVQEMANLKLDVDAGIMSVYFTQFVVQ